jgi:site-specific recombinase XerD
VDREAYLFTEGRELLWWYVEEIRGLFSDDPLDLNAPLWPSERLPTAVAALNLGAPTTAVTDSTFRKALARAAGRHLKGPVTNLHPHLLRHACATHNYEAGMTLWEVQKLLRSLVGVDDGPLPRYRPCRPGTAQFAVIRPGRAAARRR